MIPAIPWPPALEAIPAELLRLSDHIRELRLEEENTRKLMDAIRDQCPHVEKDIWNMFGRRWERCHYCGKGFG